MRVHSLRMLRALATLVVGAALVSGCAPRHPDIAAKTAETLQASVLQVADRTAAGDFGGALTELNTLQTELRQETAAGRITGDRSIRIQAAIDLVRNDLEGKLPAPTPADTSGGENNSNNKGGNGGLDDNGNDESGHGTNDSGHTSGSAPGGTTGSTSGSTPGNSGGSTPISTDEGTPTGTPAG